jgi:O-antigen/teichoic acid export membrane protein
MAAAAMVNETEARSVFKPAMLLMSGRTLAFAATFFIPVVLTRIFDPSQFGTYKQIFLIQSSVFFIAQLGMASSLYYFLPLAPREAGRYVANATVVLGLAGLACFGALVVIAPRISQWMNNGQIAQYMPWLGAYLFLTMVSAPFEIVLISRGKYLWASAAYALSDFARAAAFILAAIVFGQLEWLLKGAVLVAALRVVATLLYFRKEFGGTLRLDRAALKRQFRYALPFGLAVLVETLQASLPQYVVSYLYSPAALAIFAVGCLQVPLVDFAASPTSDVMMVKMQESLAEGRRRAVAAIWRDTTWKLAVLFFPLVALLLVSAREVIVLLFTAKYAASVPIFMVWSAMILFSILQVDGVLRVFAQTRLILALNLMRLAIVAALVQWSLVHLHLLGAALVTVVATFAFKVAAMVRIKTLIDVSAAELLPWRRLAFLMSAAIGAAALALIVKMQVHGSTWQMLVTPGLVFTATYAALVWRFDLLSLHERLALKRLLRKTIGLRRELA